MLVVVVLIVVLGAFLAGMGIGMSRLPALAPTARGQLCYSVTVCLCGAALSVATASVWLVIRSMELLPGQGVSSGDVSVSGSIDGARGDLLLGGLADLALKVGVILALAAIVYVLGPPDRRS